MSSIHGALRSFSLEALKDQISLFGRESALTLQVSDGFSERVVYWCNGRIFVLSNGERAGVGMAERLVECGKITIRQKDALVDECRRSRASLQDVLLAKQMVTFGEYEDLARKLCRDEVFDLVFWEDALFLSYGAPPPPDFFSSELRLISADYPSAQLIDVLFAWIDKWVIARPILGGGSKLLRLEEPGKEAAAEDSRPLVGALRLCRGGIGVRDLWRKLDVEFPELCDHLLGWIEDGWLSLGPAPRPALTPERAIEKLEKVLAGAVGKDLVRWKLANLYRKAKKPEKACSYFRVLHDEAAARGDWGLATESLRSLLAVRPEDLGALRQLVALHLGKRSAREAVAAVLQAEHAIFTQGKVEELKAVFEILGGIPGTQLPSEEVRADLKALSGDVDGAVEDYQTIAGSYERAGDRERAIHVLGKAVERRGEDEDLKQALLKLKQKASDRGRHTAPRIPRVSLVHAIRRRLSGLLPRGVRVPLPVIAVLAVLAGALFFLAWLPSGSSLDVEAASGGVVDVLPRVLHLEERVSPAPGPPAAGRVSVPAAPSPAAPRPAAPPVTAEGRPNVKVKVIVVGEGKARAPAPTPPAVSAPDTIPAAGAAPVPDAVPAAIPVPAPVPAAVGVPDAVPVPDGPADPRGDPSFFEDALPRGPCLRHGLHTVVSREAHGKLIAFADGCSFEIEDAKTGHSLLALETREGFRWVYDAKAERAGAWKRGEPLGVATRVPYPGAARTEWKVPADADALAIGEGVVAWRGGEITHLVRLADGAEVRSGKLPAWDEGVFDGKRLVLVMGVRAAGGEAKPWAVNAETLGPAGDAAPPGQGRTRTP